jgi:hypothetical protein
MNRDIAFGFRILLAFVLYGLANLWGQVDRFLPPLIIDLPVVFIAGVWMIARTRFWGRQAIPLLLFTAHVFILCWFDPMVRTFTAASFDLVIEIPEQTPMFWQITGLACQLAAVTIFIWQSRDLLKLKSGLHLSIMLILFAVSQTSIPILAMVEVHHAFFHVFSWITTLSLMFAMANATEEDHKAEMRFLVTYWLLISFDLLQWISLELLIPN